MRKTGIISFLIALMFVTSCGEDLIDPVTQPRISAVKEKLEDVAACINEAQAMNFTRWPVIGTYLGASIICLGSWEEEVQYNADFLDERVKWMDDFFL